MAAKTPLQVSVRELAISRRAWAIPERFAALGGIPGDPDPPWDVVLRLVHQDASYDALVSGAIVNYAALAIYKGMLKATGVYLNTETHVVSEHVTREYVQMHLENMPLDVHVKPGTKFHLSVVATELTCVRTHDFALPAEKSWVKYPFENVDLCVLAPGESLDVTATVQEGTVGYGAHALASCVGFSCVQVRPPRTAVADPDTRKGQDARRELAVASEGIVRFTTPAVVAPGPLLLKTVQALASYLRRLEKLDVALLPDGKFRVMLPEGPGSFGAAAVVARAIFIAKPGIGYVSHHVEEDSVILSAPTPAQAGDLVNKAGKTSAVMFDAIVSAVMKKAR
jgi:hypothetical protein